MDNKTKQLTGLCARLRAWCAAGGRDERGAAAVFFAVGLLLLAPATMGLVDIYMITTQRGQLQEALDTATLYAARADTASVDEIQRIGESVLRANLKLPDGQEITAATFTLEGIKVTGNASIEPPEIGPRLWDQADIAAHSEVLRNSNNIEVALVLDTTGSMQSYMGSLRDAATELVELVVKEPEKQKVYYTKAAIVPYSVGVNLGAAYASKGRGPLREPTSITKITNASPAMVTSANHGLVKGEKVLITGVKGMTNFNDKEYTVGEVTTNTFQLSGTNSKTYSAYSSGGRAACVAEGCRLFSFTSAQNSTRRRFQATNCATERLGAEAYTNAAPSVAYAGRHYAGEEGKAPATYTGCASEEIVPLTGVKQTLLDKIADLEADGSTAGQIGLAWGWYMLSPEWSDIWTGESTPAPYDKPQTLKVVVLMTDGQFNTGYCQGVNAKNSGFGENKDQNNCDATNGNALAQARSLCENIKKKKILVYTVAFNVGNDSAVTNLMNQCATSADFAYRPANGTQLKVAFKAIAQDINSLRISK